MMMMTISAFRAGFLVIAVVSHRVWLMCCGWLQQSPTLMESVSQRSPDDKEGRKERNVLFNDALNTFYFWLYGISHMVKDHSDRKKGNPLPPHRLLFPINSKGSFICTIPDRIAHTMAFVTPVVEHWLEREIAQWVHPMKDRSDDPSHHERTLLPRRYISLDKNCNNDTLCALNTF